MFPLETPITAIPRYGKLFAKRLLQLKIATIRDLLLYFPFRYEDFSHVVPIAKLHGEDVVTIRGTIRAIQNRRSPRKHLIITEALVSDTSGSIRVIWFRQPFLTRVIPPHTEVWLSGKVSDDGYGLHLTNPVYEKVEKESLHTARLVPIYSLTGTITQKQLRVLIKLALPSATLLTDALPLAVRKEYKLIDIADAVQTLHFPDTVLHLHRSRHRMAFAEFFAFHLRILSTRSQRAKEHAPVIHFHEKVTKDFVQSLPFQLTQDQRKGAWEIIRDLQEPMPTRRLLNGDVGSGKTVIAAIAGLNVIRSGYRVLFMVPTEILAEQHARTFEKIFAGHNIATVLLTASHKVNAKALASAQCIIGTHALLHTKKPLTNIGLVVIDEQHRFGVAQRTDLLKENAKGTVPHFVSMTATPIPRTLAQMLFGDFSISFLRTMPRDRKPIATHLVTREKREAAYEFLRKEIAKGRQVFVVCPLIDPSDTLGVRAATDVYEHLRKKVFSEYTVGLLHGRVAVKEREKTMRAFLDNTIHVLVATSVIEVGIDIPNATVMMIEGAERFGLAQLHQLRGRVGRGGEQSYCFLFTESVDPDAMRRLMTVVRSRDGFALAEADLQTRGPGELFGTTQSGYIDFRFAAWNDLALWKETKEAATSYYSENPLTLDTSPFPALS